MDYSQVVTWQAMDGNAGTQVGSLMCQKHGLSVPWVMGLWDGAKIQLMIQSAYGAELQKWVGTPSESFTWSGYASTVSYSSDPSEDDAETVMCSWQSDVWSQCKWSKTMGWFDCQFLKNGDSSMNNTNTISGNMTHWGQCVREMGDWGTCTFANGSMGACNWTSDPVDMQPMKWARCEFIDMSSSICFYHDDTFGNCTGNKSLRDGWGHCMISTGLWAQCQISNNIMSNCTWGSAEGNGHYCLWDTGYATVCPSDDKTKCTTTQVSQGVDPNMSSGWGLCAASNGSWGFCNMKTEQCFLGQWMNQTMDPQMAGESMSVLI